MSGVSRDPVFGSIRASRWRSQLPAQRLSKPTSNARQMVPGIGTRPSGAPVAASMRRTPPTTAAHAEPSATASQSGAPATSMWVAPAATMSTRVAADGLALAVSPADGAALTDDDGAPEGGTAVAAQPAARNAKARAP